MPQYLAKYTVAPEASNPEQQEYVFEAKDNAEAKTLAKRIELLKSAGAFPAFTRKYATLDKLLEVREIPLD